MYLPTIRCDFYRYNIVVCTGYSILYILDENDDDWWFQVSKQVLYYSAQIFNNCK